MSEGLCVKTVLHCKQNISTSIGFLQGKVKGITIYSLDELSPLTAH